MANKVIIYRKFIVYTKLPGLAENAFYCFEGSTPNGII